MHKVGLDPFSLLVGVSLSVFNGLLYGGDMAPNVKQDGAAVVFMDTETTGLSLADDIWEFAAIRREPNGDETELHLFIEHDAKKCAQLPDSFRADHMRRFPPSHGGVLWGSGVTSRSTAARQIVNFFRVDAGQPKAHVIGAVPNFDTERINLLLSSYERDPWHYHLIDIENLAIGYLHGLNAGRSAGSLHPVDIPALPWNSDDLSRACGVEPPTDERHTAMGDVRWVRALYDAITGSDQ